jgi:hypothetical protein
VGKIPEVTGASDIGVINLGVILTATTNKNIQINAHRFTNRNRLEVAGGGRILLTPLTTANAGNVMATSGGILEVQNSWQFDDPNWLSSQTDGTLKVTGNLLGATRNVRAYRPYGTLSFEGTGTAGAPQLLEVMSQDLGADGTGFVGNFAYGKLALTKTTYVKLVDQTNNAAGAGIEAVYVNTLVVPSGTTMDLNGLHLYTRTVQVNGQIKNGQVTQVPGNAPVTKPDIQLKLANGQLDVSWSISAAGFVLEATDSLQPPIQWIEVTNAPAEQADQVSVILSQPGDHQFYRIKATGP